MKGLLGTCFLGNIIYCPEEILHFKIGWLALAIKISRSQPETLDYCSISKQLSLTVHFNGLSFLEGSTHILSEGCLCQGLWGSDFLVGGLFP